VLPKVSGQISVNYKRSHYRGNHINNWENSYGIRYDHGFALHTFYVGLQREKVASPYNELVSENIVRFGCRLAFLHQE